eukprot:CAMPEP_0198211792 /NCGR_PEP_ID=MMETSP1445-20131203/25341_1 /TAXON_ID=36898 /ORGANISM="Pyramimonas sp., Strain CCMP2087" /LENGTH=350 /DNA_ID=CAMNT_0043886127 /DNA_START=350 /DNA_END=1402 /DNA_ORIENTATION=-
MPWNKTKWLTDTLNEDICSAKDKPVPFAKLVDVIIARGGYSMPHVHFRLLPQHLLGVSQQLQAWKQPYEVCTAGLFHSGYSTEMYPWGLFSFSDSERLGALVGSRVERDVFLYCTASQQFMFEQVRQFAAKTERIPDEGLKVRNFYTGQVFLLAPELAARLLVVLAADLAEQDPYFDFYLVCACLRLAEPHLEVAPPIGKYLLQRGYFALTEAQVKDMLHRVKGLLRLIELQLGDKNDTNAHQIFLFENSRNGPDRATSPTGLIGHVATGQRVCWASVREMAHKFPWFFELKLALVEKAPSEFLSARRREVYARECLQVCDLWGTAWGAIINHTDLRISVENRLKKAMRD